MLSYENPYGFCNSGYSTTAREYRNFTTMDMQTPPDNSFHDIMAQKYTSSKYRNALDRRQLHKYKDNAQSIMNEDYG